MWMQNIPRCPMFMAYIGGRRGPNQSNCSAFQHPDIQQFTNHHLVKFRELWTWGRWGASSPMYLHTSAFASFKYQYSANIHFLGEPTTLMITWFFLKKNSHLFFQDPLCCPTILFYKISILFCPSFLLPIGNSCRMNLFYLLYIVVRYLPNNSLLYLHS